MSITTTSRAASPDELAAEMDRRGAVIESLEATITALRAELATTAEQRDAAVTERDAVVAFSAKTSGDLDAARSRMRMAEGRAKNAEALVESSDTVIARMARSLFYVGRICERTPHSVVAPIAAHARSWMTGDAGDSTLDAMIYTRYFGEDRHRKRTAGPFAAIADERERCAKVVDDCIARLRTKKSSSSPAGQKMQAILGDLAAAIRSLP